MKIVQDDLTDPNVIALVRAHLLELAGHSPEESCHALDLDALRGPGMTFWSVWEGDTIAGCGALKALDDTHGEIKSMRTAGTHLRRGVAAKLLDHIIHEARTRGFERLSLETGPHDLFAPARSLYARFGFETCPPFGPYREDPYSVFMTRALDGPEDYNAPSKSSCRQAS
ncbi:GNAT family N-acetyltransferase [Kushneria indalinina]|uniref:Putative acetyltransferase n=1 Tax=Kushneria indalinina DSM 14324 TaxID=1122140 RepID=A0A3D9DXD4_9GAMM|nr:GNAT family N-acetyltransferase [Kushneria indalinina]REC94954.1 putative acetyltransferase [Kushneria indalinina DSM 14324]